MADIEAKVHSLVDEDDEMADAIGYVLRAADGGEVEWGDVREELTSGQWGRLIEKGILVDGTGGFRFADQAAVEAALEEEGVSTGTTTTVTETSADGEDLPQATWTKWDKIAGLGTVALFLGYSQPSIRQLIGGIMDVFLGPLDTVLPFYVVVLIIALITGLNSTLLQANLMDMDAMGEYQQRMKDIQEKRKEAKERGDDEALERIQQEQMEAMGDQLGMFKLQFKPMVWIMLLTIPLFLWMYWMILDGHIAPMEGTLTIPLHGEAQWRDGVYGTPIRLWILWYFLCSLGFTQLIRKALNVQTTPT